METRAAKAITHHQVDLRCVGASSVHGVHMLNFQQGRLSLPGMIKQTARKYKRAIQGFRGPARGAVACLVLLFMSSFTARESQIFPQYASKVLDWPIANAGYVISVKRFVSLLLYGSLAVLSRLVGRRGEDASLRLNKRVVVLSFATMGVGAVMLGLSRDVVTMVIGEFRVASTLSDAKHVVLTVWQHRCSTRPGTASACRCTGSWPRSRTRRPPASCLRAPRSWSCSPGCLAALRLPASLIWAWG